MGMLINKIAEYGVRKTLMLMFKNHFILLKLQFGVLSGREESLARMSLGMRQETMLPLMEFDIGT